MDHVRERVRGGMELVSWVVRAGAWRKLAERMVPPYEAIDSRLLFGGSFLAAIGVYVLVVLGLARIDVGSAALAGLVVGAAVGVGGIFGVAAVRKLLRRRAYEQLAAHGDIAVTLTSTGMLFGDQEMLWKGERWQLARANVSGRGPLRLVLVFRRRGLGLLERRYVIPIPEELRRDSEDVARTLRLMRRGQKAPDGIPGT